MEPYRYLIWLSISWLPMVILWIKFPKLLWPHFKTGIYFVLWTFVPAVIWDYVAMANGVWYFNPPFIWPIFWKFFPVEELILIFSFPWFILTTTVLFANLFKKGVSKHET